MQKEWTIKTTRQTALTLIRQPIQELYDQSQSCLPGSFDGSLLLHGKKVLCLHAYGDKIIDYVSKGVLLQICMKKYNTERMSCKMQPHGDYLDLRHDNSQKQGNNQE